MKRRIISLMIAILIILGMPIQALAATHDVEDFAGVQNAFATDADAEVVVNLKQDITWESQVTANNGQHYTINGNGNTVSGTVDVAGAGDVTVKADVGGVEASEGVNVTIDGDVNGNIMADNSTVSVTGNGNDTDIVAVDSTVTVEGSLIMDASDDGIGGSIGAYGGNVTVSGSVIGMEIWAQDGSSVTVGGNADVGMGVTADNSTVDIGGNVDTMMQVSAYNGGTIIVAGDVSGYKVTANGESNVDIGGNVATDNTGIEANNSTVTVGGNVTSESSHGVYSGNSSIEIGGSVTGGIDVNSKIPYSALYAFGSDVTIDGNVTTQDYTGSEGFVYIGDAIFTMKSTVYVGGNVTGGSAYAEVTDPTKPNIGGAAISAMGISEVTVIGNVTGGNASGEGSIGGDAVCDAGGTVKVAGTVTAGKGEAGNGLVGPYEKIELPAPVVPTPAAPAPAPFVEKQEEYDAPVISILGTVGDEETEVAVTITVAEDQKEIVIEEMKEEQVEALIETLKETIKENDEGTVTIDVSTYKEVSSVKIPVKALKAIIETFGKLEIVFNGGTIVIDAEMLEELIDELGFFTISLK